MKFAKLDPMPLSNTASRSWDVAGLTFSGLCLLHCVALPTASVLLPALSVGGAAWVHQAFAALALAATLAVIAGCRPVGACFLVAAGVGNASILWGAFGAHGEAAETLATVLGAGLLAAAHAVRLAAPRRRRAC